MSSVANKTQAGEPAPDGPAPGVQPANTDGAEGPLVEGDETLKGAVAELLASIETEPNMTAALAAGYRALALGARDDVERFHQECGEAYKAERLEGDAVCLLATRLMLDAPAAHATLGVRAIAIAIIANLIERHAMNTGTPNGSVGVVGASGRAFLSETGAAAEAFIEESADLASRLVSRRVAVFFEQAKDSKPVEELREVFTRAASNHSVVSENDVACQRGNAAAAKLRELIESARMGDEAAHAAIDRVHSALLSPTKTAFDHRIAWTVVLSTLGTLTDNGRTSAAEGDVTASLAGLRTRFPDWGPRIDELDFRSATRLWASAGKRGEGGKWDALLRLFRNAGLTVGKEDPKTIKNHFGTHVRR